MSGTIKTLTVLATLFGLTAVAHAGAIPKPQVADERVLANTTDVYTVWFEGKEPARVVILGDGDTDLDLHVYDENGNLIGSDTDMTDHCVAEWTPKWTGKFTIKVRNLGSVYNDYRLETN